MSKSIGANDVERLALGASFLASGGGGAPYHPVLMAQNALSRHGAVILVRPDELARDALLLPIIIGGPPSAVVESLPSAEQLHQLRAVVEEVSKAPCGGVLPIQIGPVNSVFPVAAAAELELPCVDADIMQHCFPSLQMTSLALNGIPMSPMIMVDASGAYSIIQAGTDQAGARLLRATLAEMGMVALVSAYTVTADICRRFGDVGSISRCIALGELVERLQGGDHAAFDECLRFCCGSAVFEGVVIEDRHDITGGVPRGVVTALSDSAPHSILRLDHGSEYVAATVDGAIVAMVPDIITLVDSDTYAIIPAPDVVRGQRVTVLSIPGDDRWRTPGARDIIGPAEFGLPRIAYSENSR
ncbi:DUF917 domain-containing protein [Nocardia africana]|uniref:Uncharacterized conserved protein n=1 Tax=Nocardia africana TaxID=134964 RepID=A0A378WXT0_9NOCA|nr:DUF917 domain-containing protein [Nocardia africana]MCC3312995.1 DUF917 domain-containing protein [Nocardia africana]SUA45662.1 Uncharacterized conserved protein [Nocardia africana]